MQVRPWAPSPAAPRCCQWGTSSLRLAFLVAATTSSQLCFHTDALIFLPRSPWSWQGKGKPLGHHSFALPPATAPSAPTWGRRARCVLQGLVFPSRCPHKPVDQWPCVLQWITAALR